MPSKPGPVFEPQSSSPLRTDTFSSRADAEIDKTAADIGEKGTAASLRVEAEHSTTFDSSDPAGTAHVTLLSRLRILTANLPLSVPVGCQGEPLACFAVDPEDLVQAGQDAWEDVVDPTFNQVIGFGRTTVEIAGFIRRGEYGMDGFCNWTESCLERLNIAPPLLEMRLERVVQAMIHLCVAPFISLFLGVHLPYLPAVLRRCHQQWISLNNQQHGMSCLYVYGYHINRYTTVATQR